MEKTGGRPVRSARRNPDSASDYGREGAPITYKAWVCTNPECGFNLRIDNGEISGRAIGQSYGDAEVEGRSSTLGARPLAMLPVLTPEQSSAWDQKAVAAGIDLATLMECAGRAVAAVAAARFPSAIREGVLVAAGPGHNGGDGWVLARTLHRLEVPVWVTGPPGPGAPLRERMAALARAEGVREVAPDGPWPGVGLLVDALLGTGAKGPPRAPLASLLNVSSISIFPRRGRRSHRWTSAPASSGVPRADVTVTFGGLAGAPARERRGGQHRGGRHRHPPAGELALARHRRRARAGSGGAQPGVRGRVVVGGDAGRRGGATGRPCGLRRGRGLVHVAPPAIAALVQAEPDLQPRP
jgi:NAD(P)H-hydrate epimerase